MEANLVHLGVPEDFNARVSPFPGAQLGDSVVYSWIIEHGHPTIKGPIPHRLGAADNTWQRAAPPRGYFRPSLLYPAVRATVGSSESLTPWRLKCPPDTTEACDVPCKVRSWNSPAFQSCVPPSGWRNWSTGDSVDLDDRTVFTRAPYRYDTSFHTERSWRPWTSYFPHKCECLPWKVVTYRVPYGRGKAGSCPILCPIVPIRPLLPRMRPVLSAASSASFLS